MEKVRLVGEAGYDGIELWLNDVGICCPWWEVSEPEKAIKDHGLIVPSVIAMRHGVILTDGNISWCSMKRKEDSLLEPTGSPHRGYTAFGENRNKSFTRKI